MASAFEKQTAQSIIEEVATACDVTVMEVTKMQALFQSTVGKISKVRDAALEEAMITCIVFGTRSDHWTMLDVVAALRELKEQK